MEEYLTNGQVEIDNNYVENKMRPVALGRKNWLFIGSEIAGSRTAIMYTIIETCRVIGIPVEDYLREVLNELPKRTNKTYRDLLPWEWKKKWEKAQAEENQTKAKLNKT